MKTMKINVEKAKQIAQREIEARRCASPVFSGFDFSAVGLEQENERFWVFAAGSEEAFDEGIVPNAIYVCVDKTDGHVWNRQEQELFYSAALPSTVAQAA